MAGETYNVIIDEGAKMQLRDIISYLRDNASVDTARHVRTNILETITNLSFMPERYMVLYEDTEAKIVYRRALKWKYIIVFTIQEAAMTIKVVDICHSAQDPKRLIDRLSNL